MLGTRNNDSFSSIIMLSNGDYIVTGTTIRAGFGSDIYVTRIDTLGEVIWENTYGGINNEDNSVSCINNDSTIIIAASSSSFNSGRDLDIFLCEINLNGTLVWSRTYPKGTSALKLDEIPRKINLSSTGLVLCATIGSPGSNSPDILALEISNNGQNINWQNQIGISKNFGDIPSSIISSRNGGYIIVGGSYTTENNYDQVIWRLNRFGTLINTIAFGGRNNENAQGVIELPNNDIVVMGNFRGLSGNGLEFSLSNIKSNNTFNWTRTYGDNGNADERAYGFVQTANGYAFCGYTNGINNRDVLLVWTNNKGILLGSTSIGNSGVEESSFIVQNANGGFTMAGFSSSAGAGLNDCYLVKTNNTGGVANNCSSYSILERSVSPSIRSYDYSESNPLLTNNAINIITTASTLNSSTMTCPGLPLKLLDFRVYSNGNSNNVTWISNNEYNLSHFEIEKSLDAINWNVIKLLKSEGGMDMKMNYSYSDVNKEDNTCLYYRLKQVDYDGSYSYSQIVKNCSSLRDLYIYPNPTKRFLNLSGFEFEKDSLINISIKKIDGEDVLKENFDFYLTDKGLMIDLDKLNFGMYFLVIENNKKNIFRIIKE